MKFRLKSLILPNILAKPTLQLNLMTLHCSVKNKFKHYRKMINSTNQLKSSHLFYLYVASLPAFTCLNLTIETLEQGVKYAQS